jgi:hypothetical protein
MIIFLESSSWTICIRQHRNNTATSAHLSFQVIGVEKRETNSTPKLGRDIVNRQGKEISNIQSCVKRQVYKKISINHASKTKKVYDEIVYMQMQEMSPKNRP